MGIDFIEMHMLIEEEFQINLNDALVHETVGGLYDEVLACLSVGHVADKDDIWTRLVRIVAYITSEDPARIDRNTKFRNLRFD